MSKNNFAKSFLSLLLFASALLLAGCSKDDTPQSEPTTQPKHPKGVSISIDTELGIEGQAGSALRAFGIETELDDNGKYKVNTPDDVRLLALIRSDDPADGVQTHKYNDNYEFLSAVKDPTTNKYKIIQKDVYIGEDSQFAPGKNWYVMFLAGGEESYYGYSPNSSNGKPGDINIPMATRWIKIPTDPTTGKPKDLVDWSTQEKYPTDNVFYPLGIIFRLTLRLDEEYKDVVSATDDTTLEINNLAIHSTALSFRGDFDISLTGLPPLNSTDRPKLKYRAGDRLLSGKLYPVLNKDVDECRFTFSGAWPDRTAMRLIGKKNDKIFSSDPLGTIAQKKSVPAEVPVLYFWAMPLEGVPVSNANTTIVAEDGSSSNPNILPPKYTYIYGKKHTKIPEEGKMVYFDATYFQPHTPLHYMAENNVARKDLANWKPGGTIPTGLSGQWATTNEGNDDEFAYVLRSEIPANFSMTQGGRTFTLPSRKQIESILPYTRPKFKRFSQYIQGEQNADFNYDDDPVDVTVGNLEGTGKYTVRANGSSSTSGYTRSSGRFFALALQGFRGNNKRRVLYYFDHRWTTWAIAPWGTALIGTPNSGLGFKDSGFTDYDDYLQMKFEAYHIGEYYLGSIEDMLENLSKVQGGYTETRVIGRQLGKLAYELSTRPGYYFLPLLQNETTQTATYNIHSPIYFAISDPAENAPAAGRYGWSELDPSKNAVGFVIDTQSSSKTRQKETFPFGDLFGRLRYSIRPFTTED